MTKEYKDELGKVIFSLNFISLWLLLSLKLIEYIQIWLGFVKIKGSTSFKLSLAS